MKKIFFNPSFLHIFYCTMLLIVSGLLWFIYPNAHGNEQVESDAKCLKNASGIVETSIFFLKNDIDEFTRAYANNFNRKTQESANIILEKGDLLNKMIDTIQRELQCEVEENAFLYYKYSIFPTHKVLTTNKIQKLQKAFDTFEDTNFVNRFEAIDWAEIRPSIIEIKKQIIWDNLNFLSASSANTQLQVMKMTNAQIQLNILNFLRKRYGSCLDLKFDKFGIAISPYQSVGKVGKPFKIELALFQYASSLDSNYHIICDQKELPTHEGIAHYEKVFHHAGKHIIKAQGIYKNPLTGQTESSLRDYSIDVLPK